MAESFSVLVVCRANVCRSPIAELLLRHALRPGSNVIVRSAGSDPLTAAPPCEEGLAWTGLESGHRAGPVTAELLSVSDLILAADRETRSACAVVDPACRSRLFTLRQAAFLAASVEPVEPGPGREGPDGARRRLVEEWDAHRFLLAGREEEDDIVDRHGPWPHPAVFEEVSESIGAIVTALDQFGVGEPI